VATPSKGCGEHLDRLGRTLLLEGVERSLRVQYSFVRLRHLVAGRQLLRQELVGVKLLRAGEF